MTAKFQRLENRAWWCAAVAMALVYLATVPRQWQCEGVDEIEYLSLAHSLSAGMGYTLYGQPHVLYPPLYAGLLSLPWRLTGGTGWPLMYALNAALGAAGLLLLAAWMRNRCAQAGRWASWLLVTAYYPWSFSTRYLLSEPLFLLLSALLLLLVDRARAAARLSVGLIIGAALLAALAALSRFAAITLVAGVAGAMLFDGWRRKAPRIALLGLAVGLAGAGVLLGWEVRAHRLDPQARESYGKWAQALTHSGGAEAERLAARAGEGVGGEAGWGRRAALTGMKTGQYVLSAPRVGAHFVPLGLGVCAIILWGLAVHLRRDLASPGVWYVAATLLVISLTSWVSSYHRYLYPLSPFLFLFAVEGFQSAWSLRARPVFRIAVATAALAALGWWMRHGWPASAGGAEGAYALALSWGTAGVLLGSLLLAARPVVRAAVAVAVLLVLGLAAQNGVLLVLRFRQTLHDATPVARNTEALGKAFAWVRREAGQGDRVISSLPAVASFLTGRVATGPSYDATGALHTRAGTTWVVVSGALRDFPAYRAAEDARLAQAARLVAGPPGFSSGDAAVYKFHAP